ncbi:Protein of unknown function [Gryllus bimaculatus]|nr:Protein of unknown function [Gryllus bimaculatus]
MPTWPLRRLWPEPRRACRRRCSGHRPAPSWLRRPAPRRAAPAPRPAAPRRAAPRRRPAPPTPRHPEQPTAYHTTPRPARCSWRGRGAELWGCRGREAQASACVTVALCCSLGCLRLPDEGEQNDGLLHGSGATTTLCIIDTCPRASFARRCYVSKKEETRSTGDREEVYSVALFRWSHDGDASKKNRGSWWRISLAYGQSNPLVLRNIGMCMKVLIQAVDRLTGRTRWGMKEGRHSPSLPENLRSGHSSEVECCRGSAWTCP